MSEQTWSRPAALDRARRQGHLREAIASGFAATGLGAVTGSTTSGTNIGTLSPGRTSFPFRARPRHCERCRAINPCLSALSQTRAPGTGLSATIRALTSSGHRRRPVGPSKTSMRETPLRLGTSIRCSIWCSTANLPQTQLQDGMPEIRLIRNHGAAGSLTHRLKLTGESMRKAAACNSSLDLSAQACLHETVGQISCPRSRGSDAHLPWNAQR